MDWVASGEWEDIRYETAGGVAKLEFLSKGNPTTTAADGDPRTLGIVTIMGYTRGEEQFEDCNANGFYDKTGGGGPALAAEGNGFEAAAGSTGALDAGGGIVGVEAAEDGRG